MNIAIQAMSYSPNSWQRQLKKGLEPTLRNSYLRISGCATPMCLMKRLAEYHRGTWLGWRSFIARTSRWPIPEAGARAPKRIDPKTVESLGIVVLSNAIFSHEKFTTCRIAQEISKVYWKRNNIMTQLNCGI